MADISKELEDISKAHYGKEVRKSFVDALNIINEVAEKAIDAGTYVDSEESPSVYYPEGSHYINTTTDDLWKSKGAGNGWEKVGNLEGKKGDKGDKGDQGLAGAIVGASAKSGACGSGVSVENKGTTQNANFEFTIEQPNDIVRIDTEESTLNYGENKITFVMRNGTSKEIVVHNGRLGSGAGSIKDSNVSEQYTWSSKKISDTLVDYSTNRKTDCLNVLGWTVPKGYSGNDNYIDETTREFVQRCDRFNIGILEWEYNSEEEVWEASDEGYNLPHISADDSLPFTYCDNYKNKTYKALIVNKQSGFTLSLTTEEESKIYVRNGSDTEKPYGYMYYSITPNKRFAVSGNEFASTVNKDYATLSSKTNVSSATLTDSADGNIAQIKMYGKSYKSANIVDTSNYSSRTQLGVTCTKNADGTFTISTDANGATGNFIYSFGVANLKSGQYFLNGCPSGGSLDGYRLDMRISEGGNAYGGQDIGSGHAFTSDGVRTVYVTIRVGSGTKITTPLVFKPMIVEGTTALPYEPYGLIMSKGEVESQSANLVQMESGGINQTTGEPSTSSSTIRSANFVDYTSTSTFVISGVTPTQTTSAIRIFEYSTNGAYVQSRLVYIGTDNTAKLTFSGDGKFKLHISTEIASVNTLMLNSGNVAKSYVPYGHSEISAYDVVQNYLLSVSDVKDELCVNADGTGTRIPRFGLLDLGTVTWSASGVQSDGTYRYNGTAIPTKSGALGLCSAFDYNVGSHVSGADDIIIHQSSLYPIVYSKTVYADANAFKTAMSGQYLIYELATVTPQSLSASQVQSLLALQTFKSHTDIVADCTVDVTYYKDNANGQSVADIDARYRKLFDSIIDSLS